LAKILRDTQCWTNFQEVQVTELSQSSFHEESPVDYCYELVMYLQDIQVRKKIVMSGDLLNLTAYDLCQCGILKSSSLGIKWKRKNNFI